MSDDHRVTRIPSLKWRYHWDVLHEGKVIVSHAYAPFGAAARALLAMGLTGRLTMYDQKGMPCLLGTIEKAAKYTITEESDGNGPRLVKFRPFNKKETDK